jgi:hypothetical protein
MKEAEEKAMELYPDWKPVSKKVDSLGVIVVMAERQAYIKGYEDANQQPEVESMIEYKDAFECPKCDGIFPKQPEQGELTGEKLWDEMFTEGECVHCDQVKNIHQLCIDCVVKIGKSTLTQDKVREAAEKVVMYYIEGFTKHNSVAKNVRFDSAIGKLEKALNQNE